jgi:hypothetical protein
MLIEYLTNPNATERQIAMKTSKNWTLLRVLLLVGVAYGCSDFLEAPPQGQLDALTLQNRDGVEATLIGAYRMLGVPSGGNIIGGSFSNWVLGSSTSDDAHKGSEPGDCPECADLEIYNWNTGGAHSVLNGKWSQVYEGVSRSNSTLRLLTSVVESNPAEISQGDANSIRGEALFLRAHYHFEAWRMWGNIPYYTEEDLDPREPNLAVAEVVPLVLADLDEAISLLPQDPRQLARASSWTARAYKGRVQAYAASMGIAGIAWGTALATLREFSPDGVTDAGPYALEENFHQVWTALPQFANGPETILAYQASVNDGEPNGENGNHGDRLNFPHAGSVFGCCGFHQPTQNLVNFFRVDANGLPLAISVGDMSPLTATDAWNESDANFTAAVSANVAVDPRLDWTVGRDGVPYKDWVQHESGNGIHRPNWIRDPSFGGFYSPKKNVHEFASGSQSSVGWNAQHLNGVNMHIFRYGDLLLLLAEAEVEAGSLENARQIVNRIRRRAGVAAQGPGSSAQSLAVPIDDPSITWADYRVGEYPTFPGQDYARTAVRYERRLELAMEGQRFFDLRRWGIAQEVLNTYVSVEQDRRPFMEAAATYSSQHSWYPIPNVQIELTRGAGDSESPLRQNDGW